MDLTNIALKGIIGVKAMGEIAHALGEDSDAAEYGVSAAAGRVLSGCVRWPWTK